MKVKKSDNRINHRLDASDIPLGRLATRVATLLRGKQKPDFVLNLNCGDKVTVLNAAKVKFTGNKLKQKIYYHYTGYPGHIKEQSLESLFGKNPEEVIRRAVTNMLPDNRLRAVWLKQLDVKKDEGATE